MPSESEIGPVERLVTSVKQIQSGSDMKILDICMLKYCSAQRFTRQDTRLICNANVRESNESNEITEAKVWAAFKIVAASLEVRGAFKFVDCFLHHGILKLCLPVPFCFI